MARSPRSAYGRQCMSCGSVGPMARFSLVFSHPEYDERRAAASVVSHLGAEHHLVEVTSADVAASLGEAVWNAEGLTVNGHLVAKLVLHRAVRAAGYKAVLTGEGADEVLYGYAHLRRDAALNGDCVTGGSERGVAAAVMLPSGAELSTDSVARRLGWVPTFLRAKASLGARMRPLLRSQLLDQFAQCDVFDETLQTLDAQQRLRHLPRVAQAAKLWADIAFAPYLLTVLGDAMEMASSVAGRLPYLDHRLVSWLAELPVGLHLDGELPKQLLRDAVGTLLPEATCERPKLPMFVPPAINGGPMRELARGLDEDGQLEASPLFEPRAVRQLLERLPATPIEQQRALDPVLILVVPSLCLQQQYRLS